MKFSLEKICDFRFSLCVHVRRESYFVFLTPEPNLNGDTGAFVGSGDTVEGAITEALFSADLKPRDYYEDGHESDD